MLDAEDDGTRIGVWVALGVVAFVLFGLIGGLTLRGLAGRSAPVAATAASPIVATLAASDAPKAEELLDIALGGELLGKVYFETGRAEVLPDASPALRAAVDAVGASPGRRILLAGFHDPTGDPAANAELAKNRAKSVREALKSSGVDAARIVLRKPESTTGDGTDAEARRVEIRVID